MSLPVRGKLENLDNFPLLQFIVDFDFQIGLFIDPFETVPTKFCKINKSKLIWRRSTKFLGSSPKLVVDQDCMAQCEMSETLICVLKVFAGFIFDNLE